jgi:hypothetical protein
VRALITRRSASPSCIQCARVCARNFRGVSTWRELKDGCDERGCRPQVFGRMRDGCGKIVMIEGLTMMTATAPVTIVHPSVMDGTSAVKAAVPSMMIGACPDGVVTSFVRTPVHSCLPRPRSWPFGPVTHVSVGPMCGCDRIARVRGSAWKVPAAALPDTCAGTVRRPDQG